MNTASSVFSNPENLPVDKVTISVSDSGVVQKIKALDPYWLQKRDLILYEKPPTGSGLVIGAVDAWRSKMAIYLENLKWLLSLEHHKFWSTVLYHPQCMDSLISFLQEASPPYIPPHECKEVQSLYEDIRRLVFVVFSRLVTNKESKTHWMTKEHMASLIYDNFVFTIPVLWDICLTYGSDNNRHVARLIESVYMLQPRYEADTAQALVFVHEAFKYIILQVNKDYENEDPPNLPETFQISDIKRPPSSKGVEKLTFSMLQDLVVHLLDTAMTLRIFVEVYPKSAHIVRTTNFVLSIVQVYEHGIPQLYEKLEEVGDPTSVKYTEVEGWIDLIRSELIDVFREILAVYKNAIFSGEGNILNHVEAYLSVMMDALTEKLLIKDYHLCHPVNDDIDMLRQAYPEIDSVKTDFILQAIYSNLDEPIPEQSDHRQTNHTNMNGHVESIDNRAGPSTDNELPKNIREQSLISEVKDILPHLGDGFVLKCLEYYDFQVDRVVNSILEDTLADSLRKLDRDLPIIPEDPVDRKFLETGVERLNVFDGDQFDIMTRDDVDLTKIHVGKKKSKYKDLKDMLNDKTEIKNRIDIYSKYNLVCDEEALYSDEYDDTYDSDGVAPATDMAEDPRRPFVTPRALLNSRKNDEASEESESEEDATISSQEKSERDRRNFCVNPEEVRARREANMAARGRKHKPTAPPRTTDVIGAPKGQGQNKDVLHNRNRKEQHKSSRANHNRRQGAQWKRSQGMMPS
ncbi:activating signal cointegrator 1 complex subunit 2 [Colias croceus]|uniref:activating signal cointegrator 1 complex subunit 2 n=1 Tax=Colias crocea TaxID=72248 RepID=UPI001E27EE4A|nr:activating signal cointegrator 1 complex subunit 2 [Colias croceus]